jgi:hypothetical protein
MMFGGLIWSGREYIGGGDKFRHLPPNIDQATPENAARSTSRYPLYIVDYYIFNDSLTDWHDSGSTDSVTIKLEPTS